MDTVQPHSKNLKHMYSALGIMPWVIALVCGCQLFGQLGPLSVGVKGGIPISNASGIGPDNGCTSVISLFGGISSRCSQFNYSSKTKYYTVGPAIELRLPLGFAVEADALYSRLSYDTFRFDSNATPDFVNRQSIFTSIKFERWEFPILLKWRYGHHRLRPFVDGGISMDHISGIDGRISNILHDIFSSGAPDPIQRKNFGTPGSAGLSTRNRNGGVLGGGIDFRAVGPIHLTPEIRYTRWASSQFDPLSPISPNIRGISLNEVTFLLGITFGK